MANKVLRILKFVRNSALDKDKKGFPIFAPYGINKTKKSIASSSKRTFCDFSAASTRHIREYYGKRNDSAHLC
jgi:hypothetical protein